MSTQLRLVESPQPRSKPRRARAVKVPRARRAHWAADWRLDAGTRRTGREGVQAARAALAKARRAEGDLRRAS